MDVFNTPPRGGGSAASIARAVRARSSGIGGTLGRIGGHNTALADGVNTQNLTRTVHRTGRRGMSAIQIGVGNFKLLGLSPFGEAATGGTSTTSVALELADGSLIVGTFGAATSIDLLAGAQTIFCDPIGVYIPPDTEFFVRRWDRVATTAIALAAAQTVSVASKQIARKGTDLSATFVTAGYPGGTTSFQIPPVAIIGRLDGPAMCLAYYGDSIGDGSADNTTDMPSGQTSFIGRSTVAVNGFELPHAKLTRGGETLGAIATPTTGYRRNSLFRFATHVFGQAGTNDITQGRTFAQMQADYLSEWANARAQGAQPIQSTIIPRVTLVGAVQMPVAGFEPTGASVRDQINAWLLAQAANGVIILDIRPSVEDVAGNPGYWKNGLSDTTDGTHPLTAAHARIADTIVRPALAALELAYA